MYGRGISMMINLDKIKMKKMLVLGSVTGLFLIGFVLFTNSASARFGFTCCPQEKADCIYEGEMVAQDKYYNGTGPCMAGS